MLYKSFITILFNCNFLCINKPHFSNFQSNVKMAAILKLKSDFLSFDDKASQLAILLGVEKDQNLTKVFKKCFEILSVRVISVLFEAALLATLHGTFL